MRREKCGSQPVDKSANRSRKDQSDMISKYVKAAFFKSLSIKKKMNRTKCFGTI